MNSLWFFDDVNLFKVLCPHKFKAYKHDHDFDAYKKKDYIYFEEDSANKVYLIEKGKVKIGKDYDPKVSYRGPLAVLVDQFSEKAMFLS